MNNLVIVESPTKARTLSKFLGKNYKIEASMGHIRDLPKSEMGIDITHDFEPKYIIPRDKKKKVNELKKLAADAKQIWLATDPDREGEAIAWHLQYLITHDDKKGSKKKKDVKTQAESRIKRVEFHEITEDAIKSAFEHPRAIDEKLVDAQQARRVLDRIVGYSLSPILWKKVKSGLSAGRVQTAALRLIVDREREIDKFTPIEYWSIDAELEVADNSKRSFTASLIEKDNQKLEIKNQTQADELVADLEKAKYHISKITKKEVRRSSPAPFTTSTLQQTAGNKLGFTAKKTMSLAQNLYEHGLITYMRTDSVNLSTQALDQTRSYISQTFGPNYLPSQPKIFKSKSKNAQEAHEAIRPTNIKTSDEGLGEGLTRDHKRLYDLIWKRTVASQVNEALLDQTSVEVTSQSQHNYLLKATGSVLKFDGWLKVYGIKVAEEEDQPEEESGKKQNLPELSENEKLDLLKLLPEQHFTEPPPRYTEASLIKKLEELGIGRPSTYAPILSTIQERFYVQREERKFKSTDLGLSVNDFLVKYFPDVFDYDFTAEMEDQLDEISRGEREWQNTIKVFYTPLEKKLETTMEKAEKVELKQEVVDKNCPQCGKQLMIRYGRFGKFLACTGFPDCKYTEAIEEKVDAKCPDDGGDIILRKTRKGRPFYGCKNWPKCKFASWTKPK